MYMCNRGINFTSVSTVFQLDFGTVPKVWYYLFFYFITYSVWTVGDLYSSISNSDSMLGHFLWHIFTGIGTILLVYNLYINWFMLVILTYDNKRSFSCFTCINSKFCPFVESNTCLSQTRTFCSNLKIEKKYSRLISIYQKGICKRKY